MHHLDGSRRRLAHASLVLVSLPALVACTAREDVAGAHAPVVYDVDDRVEPYEHPSATLRAIAESAIGVQIGARHVDRSDPSDVRITYTNTLGEAQTLCAGERFADQIEPGMCSGTLIDARHLLTAAHCVEAPTDCDGSDVWVLGFRYESPGVLARLTSDDVYTCARVLAYVQDATADHAIVELDRDVVGHTPARVAAPVAPLAVGTPLALIGHPNGIPMKIASGGVVLSSDTTTLHASVDAFSGNSGSGVFDESGQLVALLDSGADDYVMRGDCSVVNVVDSAVEDGEGLTYAAPAIEMLCVTPGVASPLCDCGGEPCVPIDAGTSGTTASTDGGCSSSGARGGLRGVESSAIALLIWALGRRRGRGSK